MIQEHEIQEPKHCVVVNDPTNEFWPGAIVPLARAHQIDSRGGCTMLCMPELFQYASGGFSMREWGAGLKMEAQPKPIAPVVLYAATALHTLHWRACVRPMRAGQPVQGFLQVITSTGHEQTPTGRTRNSPRVMLDAVQPDDNGNIIIGGECHIDIAQVGFCPLTFYGQGNGCLLVWTAITQLP